MAKKAGIHLKVTWTPDGGSETELGVSEASANAIANMIETTDTMDGGWAANIPGIKRVTASAGVDYRSDVTPLVVGALGTIKTYPAGNAPTPDTTRYWSGQAYVSNVNVGVNVDGKTAHPYEFTINGEWSWTEP